MQESEETMALRWDSDFLNNKDGPRRILDKIRESESVAISVYQKSDSVSYYHTGIAISFNNNPCATVDTALKNRDGEEILHNAKIVFRDSFHDWSIVNLDQRKIETEEDKKKALEIIRKILLTDPRFYDILTKNCRFHCFKVVWYIKSYIPRLTTFQVLCYLVVVTLIDMIRYGEVGRNIIFAVLVSYSIACFSLVDCNICWLMAERMLLIGVSILVIMFLKNLFKS